MNKTEKKLVAAIEGGDYDKSKEALEKLIALPSTKDSVANDYYAQVEALKFVEEIEESIDSIEDNIDDAVEESEEVIEELSELVEEVRVEKRGRKGKSVERKALDDNFKSLLEQAAAYNAQVCKLGNADSKFARRLVRNLNRINKQIIR